MIHPLVFHRVDAPSPKRTRYSKLTIWLDAPILKTTDERHRRIEGQVHLIQTLSQLKNVDLFVIWNVLYLCGPRDYHEYEQRAMDLHLPLVCESVYSVWHGELHKHRIELDM